MEIYLVLIAVQLSLGVTLAQTTFRALNDGRCFSSSADALAVYASADQLLCSYKCFQNKNCLLFSIVTANGTCLLFAGMTDVAYEYYTTFSPGICDTWYLRWATFTNFTIFTASGQFKVPPNVRVIKALAVGGGGGGYGSWHGGSGSGFVQYGLINVTSNQTYSVTIGAGGAYMANGGTTTFGNNLLVASGGNTANSCNGGSGGSGGGSGTCSSTGSSGGGGTSGSNGIVGSYNTAGLGQGSSFVSYLLEFKLNVLSAGLGAEGVSPGANIHPGGGGGGGVLINGAGPIGSYNSYCNSNGYGPGPASGYGAGGSAGCAVGSSYYYALAGTSGLVYIEY